jgi:hypothetical protein
MAVPLELLFSPLPISCPAAAMPSAAEAHARTGGLLAARGAVAEDWGAEDSCLNATGRGGLKAPAPRATFPVRPSTCSPLLMLCFARVEELMAGLCRAAAEAPEAMGGLKVSLLLAGAGMPKPSSSTCRCNHRRWSEAERHQQTASNEGLIAAVSTDLLVCACMANCQRRFPSGSFHAALWNRGRRKALRRKTLAAPRVKITLWWDVLMLRPHSDPCSVLQSGQWHDGTAIRWCSNAFLATSRGCDSPCYRWHY